LASFSLVRDAEVGPDRRQRRWEAVSRGFRFNPREGDEIGATAARALTEEMFLRYVDVPMRWITEVEPRLPPEWRRIGGLANTRVFLSAEELKDVEDAIERVLAPYVTRRADERPADSRGVRLMRYVLPEDIDEQTEGST
jgi:hypothetical protein